MRLFLVGVVLVVACSSGSGDAKGPLRSPDAVKLAAPSPDSFVVHFETTRGAFDMKVHRDWAPLGAARMYYLASSGFYDSTRFFRVLEGFMVQFGVNGDPEVTKVWKDRKITDDPGTTHANVRGTVSFANEGPNSRNTQVFINFKDNTPIARDGFVPIGEITTGMSVVDSLYNRYGEGPPGGIGPSQVRIVKQGNAYLQKEFPNLDFVKTARISSQWPSP